MNPERRGINPEIYDAEGRVKSPTVAEEMAYAEKPYREPRGLQKLVPETLRLKMAERRVEKVGRDIEEKQAQEQKETERVNSIVGHMLLETEAVNMHKIRKGFTLFSSVMEPEHQEVDRIHRELASRITRECKNVPPPPPKEQMDRVGKEFLELYKIPVHDIPGSKKDQWRAAGYTDVDIEKLDQILKTENWADFYSRAQGIKQSYSTSFWNALDDIIKSPHTRWHARPEVKELAAQIKTAINDLAEKEQLEKKESDQAIVKAAIERIKGELQDLQAARERVPSRHRRDWPRVRDEFLMEHLQSVRQRNTPYADLSERQRKLLEEQLLTMKTSELIGQEE